MKDGVSSDRRGTIPHNHGNNTRGKMLVIMYTHTVSVEEKTKQLSPTTVAICTQGNYSIILDCVTDLQTSVRLERVC